MSRVYFKEDNPPAMKDETTTQSEKKTPSSSSPPSVAASSPSVATAGESTSDVSPSSSGYVGKPEDEDKSSKSKNGTSTDSVPDTTASSPPPPPPPVKEQHSSGVIERMRMRNKSEPSGVRSGDGELNNSHSQRSLKKRGSQRALGRMDSVGGSSHFGGSSLRKRGSVSSNKRINVVEATSIVPTLGSTMSIDHDRLSLKYNDDNDDDDDDDLGGPQDVGFFLPSNEADVGEANTGRRPSQHMPQIYEQVEGEPARSVVKYPGSKSSFVKKQQLMDDDDDDEEEEMTDEEREEFNKKERRKYMKNLLVLCTGFFFIFTAFLSLRNLQSSLNAKGGLGMYALSATYACFFLGCIFATTIVQRLGPKRSIVISTSGLFLYIIANFYPLFYTLIPAAASAGFCQGIIWTAHATYIANIAASYTALTDEKIQNVLSRFNGIFFVFYQSCQIIGGLISSIVLKSPPDDDLPGYYANGTFIFNGTAFGNDSSYETFALYANSTAPKRAGYAQCGKNYCPYSSTGKGAVPVERTLVFILVGIFTASAIVGILTLAFLLEPLDGQMKKTKGSIPRQLSAVFRFYCHRHAVCLVGLMFYSLLQAAFMFGEYTKAFVTCTLGIHMVGFVMLTLSFSSAIAAFFNGRLQKYTGRPPLLATAAIFQFSVFLTLLFWQPTPAAAPVFFILVVFWGMGDGIIMTQDISLIGFLFAHNKEPAFAALKMTQSIANFTFFMVSPYTCTVHKIFGVGTVLVVAITGYFLLEGQLLMEARKEKRKKEHLEQTAADEAKEPIA